MGAVVYYFSGTGNSLAVARDVAREIGADLVPIASLVDKDSVAPEAEVIGIVFPVHNVVHDGLPLIVGRFVGKLANLGSRYIFAVCTCGGGSAATIGNLRKLIEARGGRLAAGFTVKMPMNLAPVTPAERQRRRFELWRKRRDFVTGYVIARRRGRYETINPVIESLLSPLFAPIKAALVKGFQKVAASTLPMGELQPLMDRGFSVDAQCNGCGICARVCPVGNIAMIDSKPVWQHRCENCFACLAWCPRAAIGSVQVPASERYHHPEVQLADMLKMNC